MTVYC